MIVRTLSVILFLLTSINCFATNRFEHLKSDFYEIQKIFFLPTEQLTNGQKYDVIDGSVFVNGINSFKIYKSDNANKQLEYLSLLHSNKKYIGKYIFGAAAIILESKKKLIY
jgi:hypothetical protein